MAEKNLSSGHYTTDEEQGIFTDWANALAEQDPALTEEIVRSIVKKEAPADHTSTLDNRGEV